MTENAVLPQTRPTEPVSPEPDLQQPGRTPSEHQSGMLTDEAMSQLGLRGQPFTAQLADGEWFADETTREQLVDIKEALISGDDLLLISGETGSGKSLLLKQLSASGGTRIQCFSVRGSKRFSTFNLFSGLLEAFKLKPPAELKDTLKEVIPCLQALSERNMLGVIVLDDADRISDEELSMLLGSVQYLNSGEDPLLRILMAAEPEFESRIPELLPTSSDLPYASLSIEPFDIGRAAAYLDYRLNKVGDFAEFQFSDQQMHAICDAANGLPSNLNIAAAAQINHLYQATEPQVELPELIEEEPLLQNRPLKLALGALGIGLILASAYLFIQPTLTPADGDDNYAVVSNKPIDTNNSKPEAVVEPERIALVEEPKTDLLPQQPQVESVTSVEADNASTSTIAVETPTISAAEEITTVELAQPDTAALATDATASREESAQAVEPVESADTSTAAAGVNSTAQNNSAENNAAIADTSQKATETTAQNTAQSATQSSGAEQAETPTAAAATAAATPQQENAGAASSDTTASNTALSGAQLESANWVLVQDPELYTVQMSASRQRSSVESFLQRSKLEAPNSIFSFKRGDSTWYALVHGLYPTITEARAAIESMPDSAKSNQPWIRAISQIQNSVKNQ